MNIKKIIFPAIVACLIIIGMYSCKKDRIAIDDYQNMDSFYNDNKEPEQEFIIDTLGSCPLIARKGTKICISADMLMFPNGNRVNYPFTLKVVELYSIKDMILWNLPAVSGSNILETSAEIRVRAFKDNTELVLKSGKSYYMEMDTISTLVSNMLPYYGFNSGSATNWVIDNLSSLSFNSWFYTINVGQMGWISAARLHSSSVQNTTVSLSVNGSNTQNIQSYISFNNFKGLIKIDNLVSGNIPVGEQVTLVSFAKKQTNEYVLHKQDYTITTNQQIPLNMQVISEQDLLAALSTL